MSKIISVNSFRRGVGRSHITANLATLIAVAGGRVGVVDTNLQSPSLHFLFKLKEYEITYSLTDYLEGELLITQIAYDMTPRLKLNDTGQLFLIPSSVRAGRITRLLQQGFDVNRLSKAFQELIKSLNLDVLVIDTYSGLNEETLLSIAVSDALVIIMRPDQQDYQGTGVMVEVARKLKVPQMLMIINEVPMGFDFEKIKTKISQIYDCEVAAVLPHLDEIMTLASTEIFVLHYPEHSVTTTLKQIVQRLVQ